MIEYGDEIDVGYVAMVKMADVQHELLQKLRQLEDRIKQDKSQIQMERSRRVDAERSANLANEARLEAELRLGKALKKLVDETDQPYVDKLMGEVNDAIKKDKRVDALSKAYDSQPVESSGEGNSQVLERGTGTFPARGYQA